MLTIPRFVALSLAVCFGSTAVAQTTIQINEIYASHSGTDDQEYIELKGTANMKLDGFMVLVVEGDGGGAGTLDRAWNLNKAVMPKDGYFVIGDSAVKGVDLSVGNSNTIENGTQTYYLVSATAANQTKITALLGKTVDSDGDLKTDIATLATKIVDIIANKDAGTSDKVYDGAKALGPDGTFGPAGLYRALDKVWCTGFLDFDDVTNKNAPRTPGAMNTLRCAPPLITVVGSPCLTVAGSAGGPKLSANKPQIGKKFTVTVSGAPSGAAALLFLGVQGGKPFPFLGCSIYLNPTVLINAGNFSMNGTSGTISGNVPYLIGLLNTKFAVQGAVGTSTSLHLTDALSGNLGY